MIRVLLFLTILLGLTVPCYAQENKPMSALQRANLTMNRNIPKLYKCLNADIGDKAVVKITAEPGSSVMVGFSLSDTGAMAFNGVQPHLGADYAQISAVVPQNGLLSLEYPIKNDSSLEGKYLYVDAFVWRNSDYSDLKLAQIIGYNAQEIEFNGIALRHPQKTSGASLMPNLPGLSPNSLSVLDQVKNTRNTKSDQIKLDIYNLEYTDNTPACLKNMKSPDLNK